ncbi:MAG TPA: hypothetical protein VM029_19900 [Opitutaceae bacterium]|nr:hypothetical protein [Opitutaceae bacterium]
MKAIHAAAAAVLALGAPVVLAQYASPTPERKIEAPKGDATKADGSRSDAAAFAVDAPKPRCEDPGAFPGRVGMQTEDRRNKFLKGIETYKTCMMNFVEERKAVIKANETAARSAIEDFNTRMKRYNEEQEKARE